MLSFQYYYCRISEGFQLIDLPEPSSKPSGTCSCSCSFEIILLFISHNSGYTATVRMLPLWSTFTNLLRSMSDHKYPIKNIYPGFLSPVTITLCHVVTNQTPVGTIPLYLLEYFIIFNISFAKDNPSISSISTNCDTRDWRCCRLE